jgi:SAM-dependent methyltransferase
MSYKDLSDRSITARGRRWIRARRANALGRLRDAVVHRQDERVERSLNVATGGRVQTEDTTIPDGDPATGNLYGAEPVHVVRWWMSALPEPVGDFTFVDLGSGKGLVLLMAAKRGFRRAIGVEFAEELHRAAQANLARSTLPEKERIDLVLGDAGSFEFPADPLVVHLNNPFHEPVTEGVIESLTRAYREHPRPVMVIYHQHRHEPPRTKTDNVGLLASVPWLTHRRLDKTNILDRGWLLQPWFIDVFESPEVAELRTKGRGRKNGSRAR